MIIGLNKSKTFTKHISCQYKCKFRIKNGIAINASVSVTIQKNIVYMKKIIFGILLHVVVKMVNM